MLLLPRIRERRMAAELGLTPGEYSVVTLHRPSNVDDPHALAGLVDALVEVSRTLPVVFPAHPRTADRLAASGLRSLLDASDVRVVEPLPYVAFMSLTADSRLVLTDSGGIQEETTVLGVPCLTLRENTERPVTVSMGTNRLVGTSPAAAVEAVKAVAREGRRAPVVPPMWDGKAAERIADILAGLEWQPYQAGTGAPSPGREQ
jgi:UDP-N-acetylglucosamine 2-epimerase (non-hydrolysing)